MVLMYHKVDVIAPTSWWVRRATFERQMASLAGRRVVHLDDYDPGEPSHCAITFDDAYENVFRHACPVLKQLGYPFEVFVNGDLIGRWNRFDGSEPLTRISSLPQLAAMAAAGGRLQWHCRTHPDLTRLASDEVLAELDVPVELQQRFGPPHLQWLAYPFGAHTPAIVAQARARFSGALSVLDGNASDRFQLNRVVVTDDMEDLSRVL
jgi:peptidoglycan/xylan/chitin deacetylase (PgdA/CDA1 family)